ncbi:hypothetical protein Tco_1485614 [Tanacetum coccineum]
MAFSTLPIKLGGLGILLAGDISKYAFLASRLQTSALQAKILMKTGIESEGDLDEAVEMRAGTCCGSSSLHEEYKEEKK